MRDEMTPKERKKAIAENRPYDRLQNFFTIEDTAHKLTGIKVSEFHLDPKKQVEATLAANERFGLDVVETIIPTGAVWGTKTVFPDDRNPYISERVDLKREDIKNYQLDDVKAHPAFADFWRILDELFARVGDRVQVGVLVSGPFSTAAQIIGVQKFLRLVLKDPGYVHELVDKVTEIEVKAIRALKGYDVIFDIKDPVSSGTLIRAEQYRTFVKPYHTRLLGAMNETVPENAHSLHICGNTSKILKDMADTGAGLISVDNMMDLSFVKREIGDKAAIVGNVKPTDTMLLGTPDDVVADLKECIKKTWDSPKHYIPAFGCGLPLGTPIENLDTLFSALREYGRFPIRSGALNGTGGA
jgi:uroporphyrinogen decarboxylase